MTAPLLFGLLTGLAIFLLFLAVWRIAPRKDPVAARLAEYGFDPRRSLQDGEARPRFSLLNRLLAGFGIGPRLAAALSHADMPMTAAEYALVMAGCGALGLTLGAWRINLLIGLPIGLLFATLPLLYLRFAAGRRRQTLTNQLPDVLTLLVGALRAGYGLNQAIGVLVDQLPPPSSIEFGRVQHAINLGVPVPRALSDMAARVNSDDLDLAVTAITVQHEMGGNLAEILDTIGDTIRARIRILRDVRVLTAQQRTTGYVLAGLPIALAVGLGLLTPDYFSAFFEPGLLRLLPAGAVVMVLTGFFIIQRIVDIDV